MNVLITGYAGFLGRHLARALRAEGFHVRVLLHQLTMSKKECAQEANEVIWGSVDDVQTIRRALQGMQVVVHSAWAHSTPTSSRPTVNERAVVLLFDESVRARIESFVFISSVAVYGMASSAHSPLSESSPCAAGRDLNFVYVSEKIHIENHLRAQARNSMRLGILRPGPIIDDHKGPIKKIVSLGGQALAIGIGSGRNRLPHIHAHDVTTAMIKWLNNGKDGEVFNVTPSIFLTNREWYQRWGKVSNRSLTPVFLRPIVVRLLSGAVQMIKTTLGRKSSVDIDYVLASATRDLTYSNQLLKKSLGWNDDATARYTGTALGPGS